MDGTFNGVFLYRGGAISTIVLEGQPSPDGSLFQSIQFPAWLTDAGEVLFKAQSLTGFLGLYKHDSSTGPLSTIVSQVTVFPAAVLPFPNSDNLLGEFEIPWINKKGDMLIRKQLSPLAIHYGILEHVGKVLKVINLLKKKGGGSDDHLHPQVATTKQGIALGVIPSPWNPGNGDIVQGVGLGVLTTGSGPHTGLKNISRGALTRSQALELPL